MKCIYNTWLDDFVHDGMKLTMDTDDALSKVM